MSNDLFLLSSGTKAPLGAFVRDGGCNFSVWAPEASKVTLVLFSEDEKELIKFDLPEKSDGVWYGFILGVKPGQLYAYSVDGLNEPKSGVCFDTSKLLIDPYAKKLNKPMIWNYDLYLHDSVKFIRD